MTGRIVDKETGEPLIGAYVLITRDTLSGRETKTYPTNVDGRFTAPDYPGEVLTIKASYIGYKSVEGETSSSRDETIGLETLAMGA